MIHPSGAVSRAVEASPWADIANFERSRERVRSITSGATRLVIFGAGQNGRMVAALLRSHSLEASAFMDDTPAKLGTIISELPVEPVPSSRPDVSTTVICSIFSAKYDFLSIKRRFDGLSMETVSLFELLWCFDEDTLPFYFLDRPSVVLENLEHIDWLASRLADDLSQRELLSHVIFRLGLDYRQLPRPKERHVGPPSDWNEVTYIDGGAFDGDTLVQFVEDFPVVSEAIGIEPDSANYDRLRMNVAVAPGSIKRKIDIVNAALSARSGVERFAGGKQQDSSLSESGSSLVRTISIDDLLKNRGNAQVYIKLDIEGAERDAIVGSRRLIGSAPPILAISLYHKPRDLWELPKLMDEFDSEYRFFVRSHGEDGADLMAYACHKSLGRNFPLGLNSTGSNES